MVVVNVEEVVVVREVEEMVVADVEGLLVVVGKEVLVDEEGPGAVVDRVVKEEERNKKEEREW